MKQSTIGRYPIFHKIFIRGNLRDEDTSEVKEKFSCWGEVTFVQIRTVSPNGSAIKKPFGFVTFKDKSSVISCLQETGVGVTLDDGRLILARQATFDFKGPRTNNQKSRRPQVDHDQVRVNGTKKFVDAVPDDIKDQEEPQDADTIPSQQALEAISEEVTINNGIDEEDGEKVECDLLGIDLLSDIMSQ